LVYITLPIWDAASECGSGSASRISRCFPGALGGI
jgi:hypothetical protein